MRIFKLVTILIITIFIGLLSGDLVFASSTDGTIDSTYKYAWGENIGWINFGCDNCNVHVTDSGLSGYALGENIGWIYLGDITNNNGGGTLSGYAWSENAGWVKFNPTNGGVIINSSGEFTGSALGENIGWIIFSGDYKVKTDWRPRSARPACNNSLDDDGDGKTDYPADPGCSSLDDTDETDPTTTTTTGGGGGGLPPESYNPPGLPVNITINDGAEYTASPRVTLKLQAGSNTGMMAISNEPDFPNVGQEAYVSQKSWDLCYGRLTSIDCPVDNTFYTVYVKFYTKQWGIPSGVVSDSIVYKKSIIAKIPEIIKRIPEILEPLIPEFLKPKKVQPPAEVELPKIPEEAPSAFQGKWQLLPSKPIREFVLAPLPKEIRKLAEKFPELGKTLKEVGITKITDIEKLKTVKLTLPGLTERVGLPTARVEPGKFALPAGVPVAQLSARVKKQIPSEIVFAKTGGELIDFNIALSVTEKGEARQKISTISGKPLQLVVKPDKPVKSVKGYVVFKSKPPRPTSFQLPFNHLAVSLIFANPVFAKPQEQPVRVEEKLVLMEFEYTDPDGDGIYTAEIQAPIVEGEYEIITVMDYEDPELGMKEIRLITVVDPEGYVYTQLPEGKLRVAGAIVSLYWLNEEVKQYELWPAKEYQQENPQITDDTGKYSFLVPPGIYMLKVEHPNYPVYQSETFVVKEGSGIHMNIELKTKFWWLKIIDWKIFVVILFGVLLLYNFYRDRIRDKLIRKS